MTGYSDPYCVLSVGPSSGRTRACFQTLNPKWDQNLLLYVTKPVDRAMLKVGLLYVTKPVDRAMLKVGLLYVTKPVDRAMLKVGGISQ